MCFKLGYVLAPKEMVEKKMPVRFMYREEPENTKDSGWRFFSGTESEEYLNDSNNIGVYGVETILQLEPHIRPYLKSKFGSAFERSEDGKKFKPLYTEISSTKGLSLKDKLENKLFNGYVIEPIGPFFIVLFVLLCCLALAVYGTYDALTYTRPTAYLTIEDTFTSFERQKPNPFYSIQSVSGRTYRIPTGMRSTEDCLSLMIESEQKLQLTYYKEDLDSDDSIYLRSVSAADGKDIFSAEAVKKAVESVRVHTFFWLWGGCLLIWSAAGVSYWFICHADKHPRIAGLFIRKAFRNF